MKILKRVGGENHYFTMDHREHSPTKGVPSIESTRDIAAQRVANGVKVLKAPSSRAPPGSKSSLSFVYSVKACIFSLRLSITPQKGHSAPPLSAEGGAAVTGSEQGALRVVTGRGGVAGRWELKTSEFSRFVLKNLISLGLKDT